MSTDELRVRMYNVGFGDCLLLFVPTNDGVRTVLVDCGAHLSGSSGHSLTTIATDIQQTVRTNGASRIDVVIASHRHFDHIAGFNLKIWDQIDVGEVWLPWTEKRGDPAADRLRQAQKRLARALAANSPSSDSQTGWLALNSLSNRGAEQTLLSGFAGRPLRRYLPTSGDNSRSFETDLLPGVGVHVLGPSRDPNVIALLDPPAGKYFPEADPASAEGPQRAAAPSSANDSKSPPIFREIFDRGYQFTPAAYLERYASLAKHADTTVMNELSQIEMLLAATALEDAINGTSLVLALDFGEHCVLLAGDAEWGTWSKILDDRQWRDVLRRTRVYKVSHHGSYNGTPKPFVEDLLPDDALSVVSLNTNVWPSIPRRSLLDALSAGHRRLVRTDQMPATNRNVKKEASKLWVEVSVELS